MQILSQKLITKHQWLVHMGTVISYTSKLLKQREIQFLSTLIMFPSLLPQFGSAFSLLKKGVSQYFCPYNERTSHWCLVMSFWLKSAFKVTSDVFSWIRSWLSADLSSSSTRLNHNLSDLALYTETLSCYNRKESCPNCYKTKSHNSPEYQYA